MVHVKEQGSYWWEEPSSQTESIKKAYDISDDDDLFPKRQVINTG